MPMRPHVVPKPEQPPPAPRPSLLAQINDNRGLVILCGVIVSMGLAFYFNDRTHLTDAIEKVAVAVTQLQAGVNQALTNQAVTMQRVNDLSDRVDREANWDRAQITEIQRKLP